MMRIGIITFHRVINYGGVLQAYALQKVLQKLCPSAEVEIVDYINIHFKRQYAPISMAMFRHPRSLFMKLSLANYKRIRNKKFYEFVGKYMTLGRKGINKDKLKSECKKYDKLVTGSDQVWNLECTGNDFTYFLEIDCSAQKYSYAASFALETLDPSYVARIKRCLKNFRNISVREDAGRKIVEDLLGIQVDIMPDPTLLLEVEEWKLLEKKLDGLPEKYNLIIQMGGDIDRLQGHMKKISQNLPVVYINLSQRPVKGMINICTASPEEWLYIINHAENIVTNSFHGCVFSILFRKVFYYELTKDKNSNSRIITLAKTLGLEECNVDLLYKNQIKPSIDYEIVELKIQELRQKAKKYLLEIIGEDK